MRVKARDWEKGGREGERERGEGGREGRRKC